MKYTIKNKLNNNSITSFKNMISIKFKLNVLDSMRKYEQGG